MHGRDVNARFGVLTSCARSRRPVASTALEKAVRNLYEEASRRRHDRTNLLQFLELRLDTIAYRAVGERHAPGRNSSVTVHVTIDGKRVNIRRTRSPRRSHRPEERHARELQREAQSRRMDRSVPGWLETGDGASVSPCASCRTRTDRRVDKEQLIVELYSNNNIYRLRGVPMLIIQRPLLKLRRGKQRQSFGIGRSTRFGHTLATRFRARCSRRSGAAAARQVRRVLHNSVSSKASRRSPDICLNLKTCSCKCTATTGHAASRQARRGSVTRGPLDDADVRS